MDRVTLALAALYGQRIAELMVESLADVLAEIDRKEGLRNLSYQEIAANALEMMGRGL